MTDNAAKKVLPAILVRYEAELASLSERWKREYLEARKTRLQFRALAAAVSEAGRDIQAGDIELARIYFAASERMGTSCQQADIAAIRGADTQTLDTPPTPREEAEARAIWRQRINAALEDPS